MCKLLVRSTHMLRWKTELCVLRNFASVACHQSFTEDYIISRFYILTNILNAQIFTTLTLYELCYCHHYYC